MVQGSGGKNKSKQQSQSTQESGTKFPQQFLNDLYDYFGADPTENPENRPAYVTPDFKAGFTGANYTGANYTGANYTPVEGGDFTRLENTLYDTQQSKLARAYNTAQATRREQAAQTGAIRDPAQFLEGGVSSTLDRSYFDNLQQAARDAASTVLGLKQTEAARRTQFDVGQAGARTAYDVGQAGARTAYDVGQAGARTSFDVGQQAFGQTEAERRTGFNERIMQQLYNAFLNKLQLALAAGRFTTGQATSSGESSGIQGSGGIFKFS